MTYKIEVDVTSAVRDFYPALSNSEIDYEGIVVSHVNHWSRIVIKLVRRYEFSRYNFTSSRFVSQKEVVV